MFTEEGGYGPYLRLVSLCPTARRDATIPKEFVDPAVGDLIANPSGVDSNQFAETIRRFFLN